MGGGCEEGPDFLPGIAPAIAHNYDGFLPNDHAPKLGRFDVESERSSPIPIKRSWRPASLPFVDLPPIVVFEERRGRNHRSIGEDQGIVQIQRTGRVTEKIGKDH